MAYFLEKERLRNLLEPLEAAAALISAATHDIDHPGTSSAFLCNSRHPLAVLYNDVCVLESHHAALTFKLTLSEYQQVEIFHVDAQGLSTPSLSLSSLRLYKILRDTHTIFRPTTVSVLFLLLNLVSNYMKTIETIFFLKQMSIFHLFICFP